MGPTSSLLFILVTEVLSAMLVRTVEGGMVNGFRVNRGSVKEMSISHLLFARLLLKIWTYLPCSYVLWGNERMNLSKSELVSVGAMDNAQCWLICYVVKWGLSYGLLGDSVRVIDINLL